jgi:CRISPR-associated protein Cas2
MNMLVTYDIADGRRLNRVAKIMKDYGLRVQKSIFEVDVTIAQFKVMRARLEKELEFLEDGVKYFPLCGKCAEVWLHIGLGKVEWDEGDYKII